ncbi:MAG: hypothetical protein O7C59_06580 [Rickettsia endosymbiont of Ixodes persulcatus]|nr:hypothetical protein [Rickettsia endosymbiont of Ixodes persulcatus]MCZ6902962.1 hypothetical protein [Rickettsia endosymbiont of Ixodes persulcatus]MCZ6908952.1 hypothetical protein [Rickettsia endosymbiont of Ixodes persulcatus]MCZ6910545.1 hypothetical protein [Rickettsia endosymbiont of Ixodes persulcatus]MCZ6914145.1 hypothetical protein [Rickettsia endosymbiont of Ixodes persulcatus]
MTKPYVIKLTTPFECIKLYNPIPDIALSSAIIMQAIIDTIHIKLRKASRLYWYYGSKL